MSPGAKRSTEAAPYAELELIVSAAVELPTVTMLASVRLAGYRGEVSRFPLSLPAAATTITSWAAA